MQRQLQKNIFSNYISTKISQFNTHFLRGRLLIYNQIKKGKFNRALSTNINIFALTIISAQVFQALQTLLFNLCYITLDTVASHCFAIASKLITRLKHSLNRATALSVGTYGVDIIVPAQKQRPPTSAQGRNKCRHRRGRPTATLQLSYSHHDWHLVNTQAFGVPNRCSFHKCLIKITFTLRNHTSYKCF